MNTSTASVLPLTAIALCLTPARIYELLGFEGAYEILEAVRVQKNQREVYPLLRCKERLQDHYIKILEN